MRADLNLTSNNASFGMALLKPQDAKAFGKYFVMDKLRFRRGVQQIQREQLGFNHTNLRFNEADNSVSVLVNGEGEVRNYKGTNKTMASIEFENAKSGWATLKAIAKTTFDMLFRPKKFAKANLYEAGEFAKQLEKEHAAELAAQAKKAAIAAKREAAQEKAVWELFKD